MQARQVNELISLFADLALSKTSFVSWLPCESVSKAS